MCVADFSLLFTMPLQKNALNLGGICTLNLASFLTIQTFRLTAEAKRVIHFPLGLHILSKLNVYVGMKEDS